MPQIEIPINWRKDVCSALETEDNRRIEWKINAEQRFEADATATKLRAGEVEPVWRFDVYGPFRTFLLETNSTGCPVSMASPPGETYEFFFRFFGEKFYGKILLRPDRKKIIIFSAHRPLRESLSCE